MSCKWLESGYFSSVRGSGPHFSWNCGQRQHIPPLNTENTSQGRVLNPQKSLRNVWSNPSWATQIPADQLVLIFLSIHIHRDVTYLEKNTNFSSQWSVFILWRASFLLMNRSVLPSSVSFWPQESFPYSCTRWHFQQARPEDIFVLVCGLWESKFITKNAQQS